MTVLPISAILYCIPYTRTRTVQGDDEIVRQLQSAAQSVRPSSEIDQTDHAVEDTGGRRNNEAAAVAAQSFRSSELDRNDCAVEDISRTRTDIKILIGCT